MHVRLEPHLGGLICPNNCRPFRVFQTAGTVTYTPRNHNFYIRFARDEATHNLLLDGLMDGLLDD